MNRPDPASMFLEEASDLLEQIEALALHLGGASADADAVHSLFRAFHTLKGSGAMFGFSAVASLAHHVESALDQVRSGAAGFGPDLQQLTLEAKDVIRGMLEAGRGGEPLDGPAAELARRFEALGAGTCPAAAPASAARQARESRYRIRLKLDPGALRAGTNPSALFEELRSLGSCTVRARTGDIPALAAIDPELCYVAWDIDLSSDRGPQAIRDVFMFVADSVEIAVEGAGAATHPGSRCGLAAAAPAERTPPIGADSVRVPSEKLDRLVNLVGELAMNQSRLSQAAARRGGADLAAPAEELERLSRELREAVLGIRMLPIGTTFGRFNRLVHDLSRELGKAVDLVTEGAATEIDKNVLDRLADPLVHLIRNSVDHGIESQEERAARGKPVRGCIRLCAAHAGSAVVITIKDDGKGLDRHAIRQKALEKGLIGADAPIGDAALLDLIFHPGLSTARSVTAVSGRGVGMDVVKRQVEALRGSVSVRSEGGRGTTVALSLPLTLAIIEGLLVEVGPRPFIVPMAQVVENVELHREARSRHNGRRAVAVRGELCPYLCLRELFRDPSDEPELEKVVLVRHGGERVGLVVDRVVGSHQTVIQSLGRFYAGIPMVSGATVLGDGRVALILDVAGLVARNNPDGAAARRGLL